MKPSTRKHLLLAPLAIFVSAVLIAGCANTVRGVGRDIRETAQAVEDSVE